MIRKTKNYLRNVSIGIGRKNLVVAIYITLFAIVVEVIRLAVV